MRTLCTTLAGILLFASACGGGKPETRAGYARGLNGVCARANAKLKALGSTKTVGDAEALLAGVRHGLVKLTEMELVDLYGKLADDVGKITAPPGERQIANQFVQASRQVRDEVRQAIGAADSGDQTRFADADRELVYLQTKAGRVALLLGADSCAPRD
jgi:hypothetical protein